MSKFINHIQEHFQYEELFLERTKYPDIEEHKELTRKTLSLKKHYETGELKPSDLFSFILDDVIIGHLIEQDCLFFNYAK